MPNKDIIINFQGQLNFEIIGHLLNSLKDESETRGISISLYKKILSVMIETLENVFKYNENFENDPSLFPRYYPRFTLEIIQGSYMLTTSNPILKRDIAKLSKHIDTINSLNKEGLRQIFRDTLTNGQFSAKGGAGLGFIEMAKISGDKITYGFEPINETFSYYCCIVSIPKQIINSES